MKNIYEVTEFKCFGMFDFLKVHFLNDYIYIS